MKKPVMQKFDVNTDAPPAVLQAHANGQISSKEMYEAGFGELRCNHLQSQFKASPVYGGDRHEAMVMHLDMVLANAAITIDALCTSATQGCSPQEIEYLQCFHGGHHGLIYLGTCQNAYKRMELVTAALVRNFVDARIYTAHDMVDAFNNGDLQGDVIVVPDFFTQVCENKSHDPFLRAKTNAYSFLIKMRQMDKRLIFYVHDLGMFVERHGGQLLHDLLKEQFIKPLEV